MPAGRGQWEAKGMGGMKEGYQREGPQGNVILLHFRHNAGREDIHEHRRTAVLLHCKSVFLLPEQLQRPIQLPICLRKKGEILNAWSLPSTMLCVQMPQETAEDTAPPQPTPAAQHCTAQHSTGKHNAIQYSRNDSPARHSPARHGTKQHNTTQHRTLHHSTAQHNTTQHRVQ